MNKNSAEWKKNERRSRRLNASCESLSEDGNSKHHCPECGQHKTLHTNMPGNATIGDPPEMICPAWEAEYYPDYDSTEQQQRHGNGPIGYWHDLETLGGIGF